MVHAYPLGLYPLPDGSQLVTIETYPRELTRTTRRYGCTSGHPSAAEVGRIANNPARMVAGTARGGGVMLSEIASGSRYPAYFGQ